MGRRLHGLHCSKLPVPPSDAIQIRVLYNLSHVASERAGISTGRRDDDVPEQLSHKLSEVNPLFGDEIER